MNYPKLIAEPDYQSIKAELIAKAHAIDGWNAELESDPVLKLLEIAAYRELYLRTHINHVAISNLVQFASGSDLDAAGAWYNVARLVDEKDERYRGRLFDHIYSMAGNGTLEHYRARALASNVGITDVHVYRPRPGVVNVSIWADDSVIDGAVADAQVALTSEDKQILGVDVNVYPANVAIFNIEAKMWLSPQAPIDYTTLLSEKVKALADSHAGLGKRLSTSKIVDWLHQEFVTKVDLVSPVNDIVPTADAVWQLDEVNVEVSYD